KGPNDSPEGGGPGNPFWLPSSTSRPGPRHQRSASPQGLLGKIGLAQPSLHLSLVEDVFFLHPAPEGPTYDEHVRGNVTLFLPKARTLKHLTVRLVGQYNIGWTDNTPYESGICLERTVSLLPDGEEMQLEKGEHTFEVRPSSYSGYERCQYGRVRHVVTAKAKGLGPMNSDVVSIDKPTYFVVNPGLDEPSQPPPPLYIRLEDIVEDLGPYSMTMQSQHCMVGGLLLFRLNLPFPPTDFFIYSIRVRIIQSIRLQSPVDKSHIQCPQPSVQTVFALDATTPPNNGKVSEPTRPNKSDPHTTRLGPMKVLRKDKMWKVLHLARLPSDNFLRPSTFAGTITPISVSHAIQMEMVYRSATEDEINSPKLTMTKPLEIFSCCCFLDSLTLPIYSVEDPNPVPLDSELQIPCVCGSTLERSV
ncbi:Proteophosphoglycan ppg4, partial [Rhodotorula sp. JG-1b]